MPLHADDLFLMAFLSAVLWGCCALFVYRGAKLALLSPHIILSRLSSDGLRRPTTRYRSSGQVGHMELNGHVAHCRRDWLRNGGRLDRTGDDDIRTGNPNAQPLPQHAKIRVRRRQSAGTGNLCLHRVLARIGRGIVRRQLLDVKVTNISSEVLESGGRALINSSGYLTMLGDYLIVLVIVTMAVSRNPRLVIGALAAFVAFRLTQGSARSTFIAVAIAFATVTLIRQGWLRPKVRR